MTVQREQSKPIDLEEYMERLNEIRTSERDGFMGGLGVSLEMVALNTETIIQLLRERER